MIHVMTLAIVFYYDIYLYVEEGEIYQIWKEDKCFDLLKFSDLLYNKMIKYNTTYHKYADGANMRHNTHHNQSA